MRLQRLSLCFYGNITSYPILADTLFGHLCWAIRDLEGEPSLKAFLQGYDELTPPVLLSDAFPCGYLPRPYLKPLSFQQAYQWVREHDMDPGTGMAQFKILQTTRFLERTMWKLLTTGCDEKQILQTLFASQPLKLSLPTERYHATIDRMTQRPLNHFHSIEYPVQCLEIYIHLNHFSPYDLYTLLTYMGRIGYGKDHSSGQGAFQVNPPEEWETEELPLQGNRVMSLSTGIPAQPLIPYYYRLLPKYGRLGRTQQESLKKPLLMHQAGSTYIPQEALKPYYGRLLKGIHRTLPEVRHYAYLLVWPFQEN